ncbi:MAG: hypothetical protein ACE37H_11800 [Phycisphaeraceae bacterium]
MPWHARFQSDPRFSQAVRFATGRPPWVLKATGAVGVVVLCVPLIALALLMIAALAVIATAWVVFSAVARVIDLVTGNTARPQASPYAPTTPGDEGRENVRVIHRP